MQNPQFTGANFQIAINLRQTLIDLSNNYLNLVNDPLSDIKAYNTLLDELKGYFQIHRNLSDDFLRCTCKVPTIASHVLNLCDNIVVLAEILVAPLVVIFPKKLECRCYDSFYSQPQNLYYIMIYSKHIWNFDPKDFQFSTYRH
jgi:hypothetical protein